MNYAERMMDEAKFAKHLKRAEKRNRGKRAKTYADHISIEMSFMYSKNNGVLIRAACPWAGRDSPMTLSTKAKGRRYKKLVKYYWRANGVTYETVR